MIIEPQDPTKGIIISSPDRQIIDCNDIWMQESGFYRAETIGQPDGIKLLQGPATESSVRTEIGKKLAAHKPFSGRITNYKKSGEMFVNEIGIFPVFGPDGHVVEFIANVSDANELKARVRFQVSYHKGQRRLIVQQGPLVKVVASENGQYPLNGLFQPIVSGLHSTLEQVRFFPVH